jgi:hypothetical protein
VVLTMALGAMAMIVAGCGGEASPTAAELPVAGGSVFGTQSTSAISGQLVGGGSALGTASTASGPHAGATGGVQISIDGTALTTTTNGNGHFLLTGVPNGNLMLSIVGNGNNAHLMLQGVGANQLVTITIQVQGSSASVVAENRDLLDEFEGTVAEIAPTLLAFELDGGPLILTDGNTWWDTGGDLGSFAELAQAFAGGALIAVEGQLVPTLEGGLLATVVRAEIAELNVEDLRLDFNRDRWSLDWIGSGNPGAGNSAIVAEISGGPWFDIVGSSIEMEGPDGTVVPFATGADDGQFEARFTRGQAISVASGVPAGNSVEILVRGTLSDGTPFELSELVQIIDDDDGDDEDEDGDNLLDPEVAAQAIADIELVIAYIQNLVSTGDMAANNAHPLITKLESAIASLTRLQANPARGQLGAFLNQLDAFARTGKIDPEHAAFITEKIELVVETIEN